MKINDVLKEFVTPQATAQDPALEREPDVDVIFYGQMPRDFSAETVWEALEAVLPREYPASQNHISQPTSNSQRITQEIAKNQGAVVTNKPLSVAQKLVKTFQTYGIKCRINAPGLEEALLPEGVAETVPWKEAQKVLNHYGADYFGTSYDKLYFYKYRKQFSVGLIRDEDGNGNHRVNLSELNAMVRKLRDMRVPLSPFGEGVAEGFDAYATSTSNTNSSPEFRGVNIPGDMKHPDWKEPTWSFQEVAEKLGVSPKELQQLALSLGNFPKKSEGLTSRYGSKAYYPRSEIKRWVNASDIRNIIKAKQGVAEQELDEKSTSQAQFRTMAAAAHNPEFARKVGIDTDVAQEFHGADRGQDYKSLPKKANEAAPGLPDPQNYDSDWDYYNDRDAEEPKDDDADYENMIDEPSDDWFDESKQKVGNMDADKFDDALARMKKLAGSGPLKTVWDPAKRVYRNMPTAVQPKK